LKKKEKEESRSGVDPEKEELQTSGETLKAATIDYTKTTLLQRPYTPTTSFVGVSGCKGGCF
jgi:iron only hydrogenase large subunit-like protein